MSVGQQLFIGGIGTLILTFVLDEWKGFSLTDVPTESFIALFYLITFGSIIAYLSFIWLLKIVPPPIVGTNTYVNPVVAVILGWIIAKDVITTN